MNETVSESTVDQVMGDQSASVWLKTALREALERDPLDALNDAFVLAAVLEERLREVLGIGEPG